MLQLQKILTTLTFTSAFYLLLGLALLLYGGWFTGYKERNFTLATGFVLMGIGGILCGLTNGFTDHSPTGRRVKQIGITALVPGILLTGYYYSRFI